MDSVSKLKVKHHDRDNDPNFRKTLNSHGYQLNILDEYGTAFIEFAKTLPKSAQVADLGVAYGFTTKAILGTGVHVFANDLSAEHLKVFYDSLVEDEKARCVLVPGNVLDIQFPVGSLHGILALRWFHFLNGEQVRSVLAKFYDWLSPGGKVVITASCPYGERSIHRLKEYEENKLRGDLWPGLTQRSSTREDDVSQQKRSHMDFDTDVLKREMLIAGFDIEKLGYIYRTFLPAEAHGDGRDHVGVIAVKLKT